jgi:hypothetical protein
MWPRWILASPSNHQRGPCPLPTPSCPGGSWTSPSNHQRGLRPLLTSSCPGGSWPPLPSPEEPRPLPALFLSPIYQAWPLENQSTEKLSTRMDLEWRLAASSAPTPCFWIMYVILLLSHFRKLHLKCCQMIGCLVLITVVF